MGKSVKKVIKSVKKVVSKAADPAGVLGGGDKAAKVEDTAPAPETTVAATPAQAVETPKEDSADDSDADTEAARKAAKARGKRGLSVARSAGTGLNI